MFSAVQYLFLELFKNSETPSKFLCCVVRKLNLNHWAKEAAGLMGTLAKTPASLTKFSDQNPEGLQES